MMSQTSLESKLEALQCHFTWDLDPSRSKLFYLRYHLEDIGTEEGNSWLGHIYNLWGYVQYKLRFTEDAQSLFNKAAEAFCQTRRADEGLWLVVNYGKMRNAKKKDPENLYLAALYLQERANKGERVEDEARELARKILMNPVSSYSGVKPLLWVYVRYVSVDEAIDLAEEALRHHPDVRYLKRCVAFSYRSKIIFVRDSPPDQSMIDRAISLHKELISIYPESSLLRKIDLANIYAKSNHSLATAEQIYKEVLERVRDLDPADKQMVYNRYATYLYFVLNDSRGSVIYHMRAAEIPIRSFFRQNSVTNLEKIKDRRWHQMSREVEEFLENLQEPQCYKL